MKRRIFDIQNKKSTWVWYILLINLFPCLAGCARQVLNPDGLRQAPALICLDSGSMTSKAGMDEDGIWDVNLFLFQADGSLASHSYTSFGSAHKQRAQVRQGVYLKQEYSIFALANIGFDMGAMTRQELMEWTYYMRFPQGNIRGMPSVGTLEAVFDQPSDKREIKMTRLMSKISITLDRSRLSSGISFEISGMRIGNCPKCVRPFVESAVKDGTELFSSGYFADFGDNASLYMLENIQNAFDAELCSFVELEIDYDSPTVHSTGRGLIYRFYLRGNDSYRVERNTHYHITICPEKDGLMSEDSWRVDRSNLSVWSGESYLRVVPGGTGVEGTQYDNYYSLQKGESRHFDLDYYPPAMQVHLHSDLVQDEKDEGRILYTMDSNGKGFTATSLGKPCLSMMEIIAEEPLNDSCLIAISVE